VLLIKRFSTKFEIFFLDSNAVLVFEFRFWMENKKIFSLLILAKLMKIKLIFMAKGHKRVYNSKRSVMIQK